MIKGKYKPLLTLKQTNYKDLTICERNDGSRVVLKAYNQQERQIIEN